MRALTTLPNGDLVAGGDFTTVGGVAVNRLARWNGINWLALGTGVSFPTAPFPNPTPDATLHALTTLPNGDLVVGGSFALAGGVAANCIARWNGTTWSSMGSGTSPIVHALRALPNGDVLAGGDFTTAGGAPASRMARWNGTAWTSLGSGMNGSVHALTTLPGGGVVASGSFTIAGGTVSAYVARLTTTCPASVTTQGPGCTGAAGPVQATATQLPWTGGTFRARTSGMAPNSLGFSVLGFTSPGTSLSLLHPAAGTGCSLHASPDAVALLLPADGIVDFELAIPTTPPCVGVALYHQVVQFELNGGQLALLTSSNGLRLTIGLF